jgi:uncharacterized protein YgiM (DUF1202 family)
MFDPGTPTPEEPSPTRTPDLCAAPVGLAAASWSARPKVDSLNLRRGPGRDCADVVETLTSDDEFTVLTVPYEEGGTSWVKVRTIDGEIGWVVWNYLVCTDCVD